MVYYCLIIFHVIKRHTSRRGRLLFLVINVTGVINLTQVLCHKKPIKAHIFRVDSLINHYDIL